MNTPIISANELRALIVDVEDLVLLDARTSAADYQQGHLTGARHASLDRDLSAAGDSGFDAALGGRHPLPPLNRWLGQVGVWGIGPATAVVVYDDQSGANAAARAWWMLRSIGHEQVAVLDGGFAAAVAAGLETTSAIATPLTVASYPGAGWNRPVVDLARVDELRSDPAWRVIDVRSAPRFRGDVEPIDPIAGHIPGAINLPFTENLRDGFFKSASELRHQYHSLLGEVAPQHVVVHCGSGVTACHTLLALEAAGLDGAALYVGSWSEWCRNEVPRIP